MSIFSFAQKKQTARPAAKKKVKPDKRLGEKLDKELPYVITLITIMAASGITPFGSFTKLARYKLLPFVMKEARNIIGQVHILGEDPLTERRVAGDGEQLHLVVDELRQRVAQRRELPRTDAGDGVRVEDEQHVLLAPEVGEADRLSVLTLQREVRGLGAYGD